MLGRNEYLMFSESDMEEIRTAAYNFTEIAKHMGLHIPVRVTLSEDKEEVFLNYHTQWDEIEISTNKSVVESWENTLFGIKGALFEGLSAFIKKERSNT